MTFSPERAAHVGLEFLDDVGEPQDGRPQGLTARIGQDLLHKLGRAGGAALDVHHVLEGGVGGAEPAQEQVRVADNGRKKVVEIVGDAASQLAHRLQLLALNRVLAAKRRHPAFDCGDDEIAAIRRRKQDKADAPANAAFERCLQLDGTVSKATLLAKARDPVADILRGRVRNQQRQRLAAKLGGSVQLACVPQEKRAEGIVCRQDDTLWACERHRLRRAREQGFERLVQASGRHRGHYQAKAGIATAGEVKERGAGCAICADDLNRGWLIRLRDHVPEPGAGEWLAAPGAEKRPRLGANGGTAEKLFEGSARRLHRQILGNRQRGHWEAGDGAAPALSPRRGLCFLDLPDQVFGPAASIGVRSKP